MSPPELLTENDCAAEDQQKYILPNDQKLINYKLQIQFRLRKYSTYTLLYIILYIIIINIIIIIIYSCFMLDIRKEHYL
jgi:hypothetical protein